MKKILFILLALIFSISSYAAYDLTVVDTKNEADVIDFVKAWTKSIDARSSIKGLVDKLPQASFHLALLGTNGQPNNMYSKRQFLQWYKGSNKEIDSNIHELSSIKVNKLSMGTWQVNTHYTWTVITKDRHLETYEIDQEWQIKEDKSRGLQVVALSEKVE